MLSVLYGRPAPPVKPSPSLEGLEQVIPPSPLSLAGRPYYLQLDKPLPEKPLPETPSSMGYSDSTASSHETSTLDSRSRYSGRQSSRYSTDSCPILVSSGSEYGVERPYSDFGSGTEFGGKEGGLESPSVPAPLVAKPSPDPLEAFLASDQEDLEEWKEDDDYNNYHLDERWSEIRHTVTDWTQGRHGPNHYFREKKWDFFPELAPTAGLSNGAWPNTTCRPASSVHSKSLKKRNVSAFDLRRLNNRTRANTFTGSSTALANNVRDSIRSVVKTLSRPSALEKEKEKRRRQPRPSTARRAAAASASDFSGDSNSGSNSKQQLPRSNHAPLHPPHYEENVSIATRLRSLSLSTGSSATMGSPRSAPPQHGSGPGYPKQLAVPLSPYQKYGAAIFEKNHHHPSTPTITASSHNRFYQNHTRRWPLSLLSTSSSTSSYMTNDSSPQLAASQSYPELPISPLLQSQLQRGTREYLKALQDGTSYMRNALDGAKRKAVDARVDRRRAQLKAQIRLIGPVNPYTTYGRVDPW